MRCINKIIAVALLATMSSTSMAAEPAAPAGSPSGPQSRPPPSNGPMQQSGKIIQTKVEIQAGSSVFKVWPSGGKTWHYGEGFLEPLGLVQYWCGQDFPEQKTMPQPEYLKSLSKAFIGDANNGEMLFCVYRLQDGDLYVYDSPIGMLRSYTGESNPRREQTMNIVVGGSGAYQGATGVWLGVVEGRGKSIFPAGTGAQVPEVLLKIMEGYVRLPKG